MKKTEKNKKLVIFQAKNGAIELRGDFENENVIWANLNQIAELFEVQKAAISKHLKNIYNENELKKIATVSILETVQKEGQRKVTRKIEYYNLDAILSVGYRVNSKTATEFRKWATKILKQHITKGYSLNKKVLRKNQKEVLKVLDDLKILVNGNKLIGASDVLELVKTFSSTWFNLDQYDKQGFPEKGFTKKELKISADELYFEVSIFKKELTRKKEATELFAQEKNKGNLEGILGTIFQTVFGEDAYPSVEEKAAHLLYFIIKNHPFNDGNKRTGAFSFIWFLQKAKLKNREKITPETLTALTLLIAESDPKDMDKMIGITLLLLKK